MSVFASSRRTIQSGEVVTFATGFDCEVGIFGTHYKAAGPFEVSASRDAVIVHRAECHGAEQVETLVEAIRHAERTRVTLEPTWRGGARSLYAAAPTACVSSEDLELALLSRRIAILQKKRAATNTP